MRRAVLLVVVALGVAGCGGSGDRVAGASSSSSATGPSAQPSTVAPVPSQSAVPAAGERAYVAQLQASGIIPRYGEAQGAIELGRAICQDYDVGKTHADVIALLVGDGMTQADAGTTNAAAIVAFCPAFGSQVGD